MTRDPRCRSSRHEPDHQSLAGRRPPGRPRPVPPRGAPGVGPARDRAQRAVRVPGRRPRPWARGLAADLGRGRGAGAPVRRPAAKRLNPAFAPGWGAVGRAVASMAAHEDHIPPHHHRRAAAVDRRRFRGHSRVRGHRGVRQPRRPRRSASATPSAAPSASRSAAPRASSASTASPACARASATSRRPSAASTGAGSRSRSSAPAAAASTAATTTTAARTTTSGTGRAPGVATLGGMGPDRAPARRAAAARAAAPPAGGSRLRGSRLRSGGPSSGPRGFPPSGQRLARQPALDDQHHARGDGGGEDDPQPPAHGVGARPDHVDRSQRPEDRDEAMRLAPAPAAERRGVRSS